MPAFIDDTIVAISTPPGRGGIGIVRLSGPLAKEIALPILRLRQPLSHAMARFAEIVETGDADAKLDEAVVTYFAAPNSYTTEDVVEIAGHGSPVVLEFLVRHALAHGARLARAGEFTERAFLNGRMDLTQAEAVGDLIDAQTIVQVRLAAEQMGGALSRRIAPVKELLVTLIAVLEAGVDFAEDDIDVLPYPEIAARINAVQGLLMPIAASYAAGRLVHDGFTIAIAGKPNAGKSSLFNRLVERDRAIVTAVAGTTRDLVKELVSIEGIPIELLDTAGLRVTSDEVEAIGIEKTREAMADADVILAIFDAAQGLPAEPDSLWEVAMNDSRSIVIANKVDLLAAEQMEMPARDGVMRVSALTGEGIADLRKEILRFVHVGGAGRESGMLTNARHHEAATQCEHGLAAAQQAVAQSIPHEMLLLDLYSALQALDSLTGATSADDILHRIFSSFCIGK